MSEPLYDVLSISGMAAALSVMSVSVAASEIELEGEVTKVELSDERWQ